MQLHSQQPIEAALAEFIAAAFSPEECEIAKLKAQLDKLRPRSQARVIVQRETVEARLRQLRRELA